MRKRFPLLFILFIIASFIMLTGHVHLRQPGHDDEAHCPFCALRNTGFSFALPFALFLYFTVLATLLFTGEIEINPVKIHSNQFRAPPSDDL